MLNKEYQKSGFTLIVPAGSEARGGVVVVWNMDCFLAQLQPKLPAASVLFLKAIVAAMNDRAKLPELDGFPVWRDQPPLPLEG